jgi:hypothetical protein
MAKIAVELRRQLAKAQNFFEKIFKFFFRFDYPVKICRSQYAEPVTECQIAGYRAGKFGQK